MVSIFYQVGINLLLTGWYQYGILYLQISYERLVNIMTRIPKYITKDIEQISKYARKIEVLVLEVEEWYDKKIESYGEEILDEVSDEELDYISNNEADLKEFSLGAIIRNLQLFDSYLNEE